MEAVVAIYKVKISTSYEIILIAIKKFKTKPDI